MKKKLPYITALIACVLSLAVGASFHGMRLRPENTSEYQLGCTMGIVMASIAGAALIAFIILLVLYKKSNHQKEEKKQKR